MKWYIQALKKYAVFSGRAQRKEYWVFALLTIFLSFFVGLASGFLKFPALNIIYSLVTIVPIISVTVRRMHDTGRSGWWAIVPIIGLVFLFLDSQPEENRFGSNPKTA